MRYKIVAKKTFIKHVYSIYTRFHSCFLKLISPKTNNIYLNQDGKLYSITA
jgi:hypothetical protein